MPNTASLVEFPNKIYAKVDGWPISIATSEEAIEQIVLAARQRQGFSVCTLNLDHLVKLRRNVEFRQAYRAAKFVTADGAPVAWLARRAGGRVKQVTGADLVAPLAQLASTQQLQIFLFGSTPEVLDGASQFLMRRSNEKVQICGTQSPSRNFDPKGPEADSTIKLIQESGASICFLALGAPKQELFAAYALAKGAKVGFVSIGAGLDFLAGTQVRAPAPIRRAGLEWAWRLWQSPQRMFGRYFNCALLLLDIVALAPVRHFYAIQCKKLA